MSRKQKSKSPLPEKSQVKNTSVEAVQPNSSDTLSIQHNPATNPKAISLIQQDDGNWKGWMQRFGKVIEVREISPYECLIKLLTHDGK